MIKFQNVTKQYSPDVIALKDFSLEIKDKEFLVIAGKSGMGKTTLLKLIIGEISPTKGRVFLNGQDVHKIEKKHLPFLRRKIGAVFQDYKLLESKTVEENVAFIMQAIGAEDKEIKEYVDKVLEIVDLTDKREKFPRELSSGQCQRAAIARALIHRPKVILADEPTGNLDPHNTSEIIDLLVKINELGTTVVLATHNKEVIKKLKKRAIILENGELVRDVEDGKIIF